MFVTAFLRPKTAYRSVERYFEEFETLSNTGIPILLFLDVEFLGRSFPPNVRVVPTTLDMSWVPEHVDLPAHRNPSKDTLEYFCIQLSKLAYLNKAREHTSDRILAWIDFGVFHMFKDKPTCTRILQEIANGDIPSEKILAPGCWPAGHYDWNSVCWRFCGSFLIGHRDLFPVAYQTQMQRVRAQLPRVTWEVNYWAQMESLFHVYPANHDDSLVSRVMVFVQRHQGVSTASSIPDATHPSTAGRMAS